MVTAAQIKKLCPSARPALIDAIVSNWDFAELRGNIITPLRVQHFLAEIATETGGLKAVEESLNYTVSALLKEFGRHRISEADAKRLGRMGKRAADQEAIANTLYGGAWGKKNLGNTQPGDGWKYRGGGMMQTTGRANYRDMGFEANPEALRDPVTAFKTAVLEWAKRGCNEMADRDDLTGIRKVINGGDNGLDEARKYLTKARAIFTDVKPSAKPVTISIPVTEPAKNDHLIEQVQDLLWDKGYPEVGESDNKFGKRTRNAILAFQADNNLPLTGQVTDDLLAQLVKAPKRVMDSKREEATAKDLKAEPIVQTGDWLKKIGGGITIGSLGLGGIDSLDSLNERLNGVQKVYQTLTSFAPWLIYAAVGGAVFYFGSRIIRKYVEAYREGRAL